MRIPLLLPISQKQLCRLGLQPSMLRRGSKLSIATLPPPTYSFQWQWRPHVFGTEALKFVKDLGNRLQQSTGI